MSRKVLGTAALTLLVLAFALGYRAGLSTEPPREPPRVLAGVAPPSGEVGADLYAALTDPNPLERASRVGRVLDPLGPDALAEVRSAYDRVLLETGDVELVLLAEWWARFDPAGALAWARASLIGWHPAVITAVVRSWARRDPEAATRAVRRFVRDPLLLAVASVALARGWDESGREGLRAYLASLPTAEVRQESLEALARVRTLREGPDAAIAWAEAFPDPEPGDRVRLKLDAYRRVAGVIAAVEPERAAAWAARQADGPYASGLYRRVAVIWAERDGAAAMRWLSTLPEGSERGIAVQETYRTWLLREPDAAAQWLRAAPLEPWLDPAVAGFALGRATADYQDALSWASRVHEPWLRDRTTVKIALAWLSASPEQARAWLEQAGLPEALRGEIERRSQGLGPTAAAAPADAQGRTLGAEAEPASPPAVAPPE